MFANFQKVFKPTKEDIDNLYISYLNSLIINIKNKDCSMCKHCFYDKHYDSNCKKGLSKYDHCGEFESKNIYPIDLDALRCLVKNYLSKCESCDGCFVKGMCYGRTDSTIPHGGCEYNILEQLQRNEYD